MTQAASMAGRKRKPGVARTKSGQQSRAQEAYQEHVGPIMTRMRLYGLNEKDARDQKAESVIGRLAMMGQQLGGISNAQYDALTEYRSQVDAYRRAIEAKDGLGTGGNRTMTPDEEQHAKWCRVVIGKWEASRNAIMREQCEPTNRGHNLMGALDAVVIRNTAHAHLYDAIRVAANALVRHYRMAA